ncbi:type VI secretion-associated protein, VC_A0118 family [Budvicia aquatica]|nr:type VI secretion-associated protein, VC_A0118 family [Budvicia aquatica]
MLAAPMTNDSSAITLRTGKEIIKTNWFSRDNGYVFEASRGLPGIQEIQRLIHGDTLTIESSDPSLNGLVFNLSTLPQAIAPLRSACRW